MLIANNKVTLDTSVFPAEDILAHCRELGLSCAVVTVTQRESATCDFRATMARLDGLPESGVYGESRWNVGVYGSDGTHTQLDRILAIISNNSFPSDRRDLNKGQRHQLRDAMIFQAHVQHHRDIFVTEDCKGFIRGGRRHQLEFEFRTQIMTKDEFLAHMREFTRSHPTPRGDQ